MKFDKKMQALCGLQGIFDLFNCKTPVSLGIVFLISTDNSFTSSYFKLNLTILTIFANIIIEIGTTDKRLVQIHISYEK